MGRSAPNDVLDRCYRQFGFRVYRRSLAILGREEDARDCVQQVFLQLSRSLEGFRGDSSIATWIYVVTTREALQIKRSQGRRGRREERWADAGPRSTPSAAGSVEARQLIGQLVDRVPDAQLEAAVLYFVDGLDQGEIARLLGVSRRTVIRRINDVRDTAREIGAAEGVRA